MTSPDLQSGTDRIAHVAARLGARSHRTSSTSRATNPPSPPRSSTASPRRSRATARWKWSRRPACCTDPEEIANPNCVKVVLAKNGDALYFSRSVIPHPFGTVAGAAGVAFHRHQGIYGYERRFLARFVRWQPSAYERAERLEQLRALEHGARIRVLRDGPRFAGRRYARRTWPRRRGAARGGATSDRVWRLSIL